jgi:hypothetical protein
MKTIKVPFLDGDLMSYPWHPREDKRNQIEWKDSFVFTDELVWDRVERGRSAVTIYLKSIHTGRKYPCFISSLESFVLRNYIDKRSVVAGSCGIFDTTVTTISGSFGFIKRGENYSIHPAE